MGLGNWKTNPQSFNLLSFHSPSSRLRPFSLRVRSAAEEWSEIDLRDPPVSPAASDEPKHKGFVSMWKSHSGKKEQDASHHPSRSPLARVDQNHHASVLMAEISQEEATPTSGKAEKGKRSHLTTMFQAARRRRGP